MPSSTSTTIPGSGALEEVERHLRNFPPLVFIKEVSRPQGQTCRRGAGSGFLLQGGDCAESFKEHKTDSIRDHFQLFLQMALILTIRGHTQVVKLGRVAGQFAKPRSSPSETKSGKELRTSSTDRSSRHRRAIQIGATSSRPTANLLPRSTSCVLCSRLCLGYEHRLSAFLGRSG
jgi:3-deoxy-D-arabino-heptulosonate 7-phosphate (DAHP) synthase class II